MKDTATGKKPWIGNRGSVNHEINAAVFTSYDFMLLATNCSIILWPFNTASIKFGSLRWLTFGEKFRF